VSEWREGQARIAASCHALADTVLLATKAKPIYGEGAFAQRQAEHIAQVGREAHLGGEYCCNSSLLLSLPTLQGIMPKIILWKVRHAGYGDRTHVFISGSPFGGVHGLRLPQHCTHLNSFTCIIALEK